MLRTLTALLIFAAAPALAAPPKAFVSGPTVCAPGEMITLDASSSDAATHYLWRVTPELPGRKQCEPCDDGQRCRVASYPGTWLVTLVASNAEGSDLVYWTIHVPGTPPGPGPGPQPVPPSPPAPPAPPGPSPPDPDPGPGPKPPAPDIPVGEFDVARPAYRLAVAVTDPDRSAKLATLAMIAEATAAKVAAGSLTNAQALLQEIAGGLDKTLDDQHGWPDFRSGMSAELQRAYAQHKQGRLKVGFTGGMSDPAGWSTLLTELATGLAAATGPTPGAE